MTITMYGIPNCDTVKKAKKWLDAQGIVYAFHDYKKSGADKGVLTQACAQHGWEVVLNKRGTTWRKLDEAVQSSVTDEGSAVALMCEQTSLIKRPILVTDKTLLVGFSEDAYTKALK
ncbi:MAG: ArsC family reductase [Rickettsiales bacterium]|nr:ArsC family reductase [Rickettsiales bacterium]